MKPLDGKTISILGLGASGAAAACYNESKWTFDKRHAVFIQRQQFVHGDGQIIQVFDGV